MNLDAEEPQLPLTQPTPTERLFQERFQERLAAREIEGPQRLAQRLRTMPQHGQPGSRPHFPNLSIFPSLPLRAPPQSVPSATDLLAPWYGDLLHNTSTSLVILLQRGQIEDGGPELTFQAIYEGLSRDQFWGLSPYPRHPVDQGVGHTRWLFGQPELLPPEHQAAHVADIVHRVLRFLGLPQPPQGNQPNLVHPN
jgi:hypothetical protein